MNTQHATIEDRHAEQVAKWQDVLSQGRAHQNSTMIGVALAILEVLDDASRPTIATGTATQINHWQALARDFKAQGNHTGWSMSRNVLEVLEAVAPQPSQATDAAEKVATD